MVYSKGQEFAHGHKLFCCHVIGNVVALDFCHRVLGRFRDVFDATIWPGKRTSKPSRLALHGHSSDATNSNWRESTIRTEIMDPPNLLRIYADYVAIWVPNILFARSALSLWSNLFSSNFDHWWDRKTRFPSSRHCRSSSIHTSWRPGKHYSDE